MTLQAQRILRMGGLCKCLRASQFRAGDFEGLSR
jgi:hypothetical protein